MWRGVWQEGGGPDAVCGAVLVCGRPAPRLSVPRKNVIIRLCSIECNFAAPLTDPSNAPFQKDMDNWAAISNRTYVWCVLAS